LTPPPSELIERLAAWFIFRRYSRFVATDSIAEFKERKAHGYKDILVTHFRWNGHDLPLDRQRRFVQFSRRSYAWSQMAVTVKGTTKHSHSSFYEWGVSHYRSGNYAAAAKDFEEAFKRQRSRPNLLRYAAEAHWRNGDRNLAKARLIEAIELLPRNKRARLRLLTIKFPPLQYVIGKHEMEVPNK
ncbi:glycosyltransferase, partial [Sinorhizobium medicae]